jgi:hypothetical protein
MFVFAIFLTGLLDVSHENPGASLLRTLQKKKGSRLIPTFVNLKSNTMKNTMQIYGL